MKKNDFNSMCDELEKCNKCNAANEIVCATSFLMKYSQGDRKSLLKIKAEAMGAEYIAQTSLQISTIAMVFTAISTLITAWEINSEGEKWGIYIFCLAELMIIYFYITSSQTRNTKKWQKYILLACEELLNPIE